MILNGNDKAGRAKAYNTKLEMEQAEEIERCFSMLERYGIPRGRARSVYNGIQVLVSRIEKDYNKVESYLAAQKEFSSKTFGEGCRTNSVLKHLEKEIIEVKATPDDIEEWADCFILLMDGLWRRGFLFSDLFTAVLCKFEINKNRKWKKPDKDGVIEHEK